MKRTLIALVLAMGLVVGLPGSASAHDTDDWSYTSFVPGGYGYVGYSSSHVGGVYQLVNMWRLNNYLVLSGYASDTRDDGYCGAVQVRYETYDYGADEWSGHWHKRSFGIADCSTGGTENGVSYKYSWSNQIFRNLSARACHADSSGNLVECESNWHGPI